MTRILVCGGRDFPSDKAYHWLEDNLELEVKRIIPEFKEISLLIEGHAKGADQGANRLAVMRPLPHLSIPAQWEKYGKVAGIIRNKRMLEEGKPDIAVAFPGGPGTCNMVDLLQKAGVTIIFPYLMDKKQEDANLFTLPRL